MSKRPAKSPIIIEEEPKNVGAQETRYIVRRGHPPFDSPVGYVTKIRNTRTETHPWKAFHIGWNNEVDRTTGRHFYDDSRYAGDGAYSGGKKAAFEYASKGKGFDTFDKESSGRTKNMRKNPRRRTRKTTRKNPPPVDALELLEEMIDKSSVKRVVGLVAEVCELKAQHIRENWQDMGLARAWEHDAKALINFAFSKLKN